jgi:hypothetical protein
MADALPVGKANGQLQQARAALLSDLYLTLVVRWQPIDMTLKLLGVEPLLPLTSENRVN